MIFNAVGLFAGKSLYRNSFYEGERLPRLQFSGWHWILCLHVIPQGQGLFDETLMGHKMALG